MQLKLINSPMDETIKSKHDKKIYYFINKNKFCFQYPVILCYIHTSEQGIQYKLNPKIENQ